MQLDREKTKNDGEVWRKNGFGLGGFIRLQTGIERVSVRLCV